MLTIPYSEKNITGIIAEMLKILDNGGIIAYPTESFYALGVLATDKAAVKSLFERKIRQADKPVPVIIDTMDRLLTVASDVPEQGRILINQFWPGPLTLIFEANEQLPDLLTGGTGKVALRIPGESAALNLIRELKLPLTATSANISSFPPAEEVGQIVTYFGDKIDLIIDGGKAPGGLPSTIVDLTVDPPAILRKGPVSINS